MNLKSFEKAHRIAARHREVVGKKPLFAKKTPDATSGALYIYEVIGEDWWTGGGMTGKKVADALEAMKGVKTLDIFINSEGGDVFEAKAIYSSLVRFDAEKVVHVDGICASAASFIAMAGDQIITSPVATWMIHEARAMAFGRSDDMRAMADLLDMENRTLAETYSKQTGASVDDVLGWMNDETWMNAQLALDRGFTDSISEDSADEAEPAAAAASTNLVQIEASTRQRVALARQGQRLAALKNQNRSGQPGETTRKPASR